MADCFDDCKIHKYKYGRPQDFRESAGGAQWVKVPKPNAELVKQAQDYIDALPKEKTSKCGECECVEDETQIKPYPKKSVARTVTVQLPKGAPKMQFSYTVEFTTYTGQCD
jgi:hypothetical protein